MRSIIFEKSETYYIKLFELPHRNITQEVKFHSVPRFKDSTLPKTIMCIGEDCPICKIRGNLNKRGAYQQFKDWFLGIYKVKCNLDTFSQWLIPVGLYDTNYTRYSYGAIRLWDKQMLTLLSFVIDNNLEKIGEFSDFNVLKITLDKYGNFSTISIDKMIKHFPDTTTGYQNHINGIHSLFSNPYNEMNISDDKYSIQSVAYTILNIIKDQYLRYNQ